jgi:hypothetical protein
VILCHHHQFIERDFKFSAVNDSDLDRVVLLLDFNAGPIDKEQDNDHIHDEISDDKSSEINLDQRKYLDYITKRYGFGDDNIQEEDTTIGIEKLSVKEEMTMEEKLKKQYDKKKIVTQK